MVIPDAYGVVGGATDSQRLADACVDVSDITRMERLGHRLERAFIALRNTGSQPVKTT